MNSAMNVTEKQILRGRVLHLCEDAEPIGAGTEVMAGLLVKEGYFGGKDKAKEEVAEICSYLSGKGLIEIEAIENRVLGISRDIAKITPKGIDVIEGTEKAEGLIL